MAQFSELEKVAVTRHSSNFRRDMMDIMLHQRLAASCPRLRASLQKIIPISSGMALALQDIHYVVIMLGVGMVALATRPIEDHLRTAYLEDLTIVRERLLHEEWMGVSHEDTYGKSFDDNKYLHPRKSFSKKLIGGMRWTFNNLVVGDYIHTAKEFNKISYF
jgi:hypothetical protein